MEHLTGIGPAYSAWEADVLPLNYRCMLIHFILKKNCFNKKEKAAC